MKVESPGGGDDTRGWGPFWNGLGYYFLGANRNKKRIPIDLRAGAGKGHQAV